MDTLVRLVAFEIGGFLAALLALVFFQIMTGRINTRGLLTVKRPARAAGDVLGGVSPTRVQLLVITLLGAFGYLAGLPAAAPGSLPEIPRYLLYLVGGGASIYLAGKGTLLIRAEFGSNDTTSDERGS